MVPKVEGAIRCLVLLLLFAACNNSPEHVADAVDERDSVAMMVSHGVNTLISDSGVIKYRIVTEEWAVNTNRQPQRWEFMKGIFFEQFDQQFHVEAYIQADTAWYFDQLRLWHLRGRVQIRNIKGLIYTSEELFWDGLRHEFYSHVFSRIVTPERTMEGTEFRSDEHMDHYRVSNSVGSFLREDTEGKDDNTKPANNKTETDNEADTLDIQPIRPAAQKHTRNR